MLRLPSANYFAMPALALYKCRCIPDFFVVFSDDFDTAKLFYRFYGPDFVFRAVFTLFFAIVATSYSPCLYIKSLSIGVNQRCNIIQNSEIQIDRSDKSFYNSCNITTIINERNEYAAESKNNKGYGY